MTRPLRHLSYSFVHVLYSFVHVFRDLLSIKWPVGGSANGRFFFIVLTGQSPPSLTIRELMNTVKITTAIPSMGACCKSTKKYSSDKFQLVTLLVNNIFTAESKQNLRGGGGAPNANDRFIFALQIC